MDSLPRLAGLLHRYNEIGHEIAQMIGRPAQIGHVGEYIAASVFDIRLEHSASAKAIDGHFSTGPLAGSSVNIKWYGMQESILDLNPGWHPDYFLVLAGPPPVALTSRGGHRPWLIRSVYLFAAEALLAERARQGVRIGVATSVPKAIWEAAMIYPHSRNGAYVISEWQRQQIALFW